MRNHKFAYLQQTTELFEVVSAHILKLSTSRCKLELISLLFKMK